MATVVFSADISVSDFGPVASPLDIDPSWVSEASDNHLLLTLPDGETWTFSGLGVRYDSSEHPISGMITGIAFGHPDGVTYTELHISAPEFFNALVMGTYFPLLDGDDTVTLGDAGNRFIAYSGNDTVFGGQGQDYIYGGDGNDILYGGPGSDGLSGEDGNDHLYGQSPNGGPDDSDALNGGNGSDYIQGNAGNDYLYGDDGSDRIQGGQGDDHILGGEGNDTVNGNLGRDVIDGGEGNDSLRGGQGDDTILGGNGNDIVLGDLGKDVLTGGDGIDIFVFSGAASPVASSDTITDFVHGTDLLSIGFTPTALLVGVTQNSLSSAETAAQQLFDSHGGDHEVAAIGVGNDTYLFYSATGGATLDSAILLANVSPNLITIADFD